MKHTWQLSSFSGRIEVWRAQGQVEEVEAPAKTVKELPKVPIRDFNLLGSRSFLSTTI